MVNRVGVGVYESTGMCRGCETPWNTTYILFF